MTKTILRIFELVKKGELKFLINSISKRILSKTQSFGLKRDLNEPFKNPDAQVKITIRPLESRDEAYFTADLQNDGLVEKNIPSCYVATNSEDKPLFRQWLIGWEQNDKIKEFWGPAFPVLNTDEALLEGGFTIPKYRCKGIMPAGITKIIDRSTDMNVRRIITFVGIENIPSLKGVTRAGFSPYVLRTEKWFLFKRSVLFSAIPNNLITKYANNVGS